MTHTRSELAAAIRARLETDTFPVFLREMPQTPPPIGPNDPRARGYAVLFPSPGAPGQETDQADEAIDNDATFQVTVINGIAADHDAFVDYVAGQLERWSPFPDDPAVGTCHQLNDPGPGGRDDDGKSPPRFFTPLQYRVAIGN